MIGFVYILTNHYFESGVYKVGCTERAPHARADELSKATGVPAPFDVLCYIEVDGFQTVERDLHKWLAAHRISENREFFDGGLEAALGWLWWHPISIGFHGVAAGRPFTCSSFIDHLVQEGHVSPPNGDPDSWNMHLLANPWDPVPASASKNVMDTITGDMPWETPSAVEPQADGGAEL